MTVGGADTVAGLPAGELCISTTGCDWVGSSRGELQRQLVLQHSVAVPPPREDADEIDRVELDRGAASASCITTAGRTAQVEGERIIVQAGPFGDDVGHDAPVVLGSDHQGPAHG